ncbi:hypothetical protein CEXT_157351 [Caerostris extrusa]|uniref:Uncharacterized protein n=1 Tax=Caerostris extrusa TaxID=172846 RepID=A0AAV4ND76_CAEEX|nr:hypothetical protein CEXT_157351 [Caerostris extrusa]
MSNRHFPWTASANCNRVCHRNRGVCRKSPQGLANTNCVKPQEAENSYNILFTDKSEGQKILRKDEEEGSTPDAPEGGSF